jgi:muramoyltetrapeptide carboxypeptidase
MKIGVVAPACRIEPATAEAIKALAARLYPATDILVHPQCHLSAGHFAGDDAARASAFLEMANDEGVDAVWFARGGYGSDRIALEVIPKLGPAARRKTYLGYSDMGFLLAGLYRAGIGRVAHGPHVQDLHRENGAAAVTRALRFLVEGSRDGLEPSAASGAKTAAFNITILSHLIGTPLEPDLSGHILLLEEVSEPMYRIDRALFHITASATIRKAAGIKLGRCSAIPPNDPDFGQGDEEVMRHWCRVSGIPYLGRADIGHDADNKIVPFGALDRT